MIYGTVTKKERTKVENLKKDSELKQELKEKQQIEREKLKAMNFGEKIDYIWTYYKAPILITLFLLISVIYTVHHFTTNNQESILYSMVINADATDQTNGADLYDAFLEKQGYDTENYKIERNTSIVLTKTEDGNYTDPQMLSVMYTLIMAGTVDHVLANEDTLLMLSENGYVMPLSSYMSEEEIAKYDAEGRVLYAIDPETNENTAFCISLEDCEKIENSPLFYEAPYFGMIYGAEHEENSIDFLYYLLEE